MASDEIREVSSSGGAFTVLARNVFARGGAVCGAAFDGYLQCRCEVAEDEAALARLRGSKYVRAAMSADFLRRVRGILESGRPVLFSGTPCQVAAARRIFAAFADAFFTVDLICAGCPDQKLFDRYLDDNWGRGNVLSYEFRSKARGWRHHHYLLHVVLKDGREIWREKGEDEYMTAMSSGLGLSNGCLNCPFCTMDRPGDLTIGDFWRVPEEMDDGKGTSAILVNTEKGRLLFESVRPSFAKVAEYLPSAIQERQLRLRTPPTPAVGRTLFWKCIASGMSVKESVAKALSDIDRNVAVLNFHWETVNFGAVLTAYALNRGLRDMGFEVRNIDFRTDLPRVLAKPENAKFEAFRRRHVPATQRISDASALRRLNALFASFVVGSDQVWNPDLTRWYKDVYFLSFADPDKRLVAAAASFGIDPAAYGTHRLRAFLGAFDGLGVREESAARQVASAGLDVKTIADPVFLLTKEDWLALAATRPPPCGADVVWYAVNPYGKKGLGVYLAAHSAALEGRLAHLDASMGVEEWLAAVSNASLVLTDSFHGVCFAVIFGRPFAVLVSKGPKSGRMRDFLSALGLSGRMFEDPSEMPPVAELERPIDFSDARARIVVMRRDLVQFLKASLERPVKVDAARVRARVVAAKSLLSSHQGGFVRAWGRACKTLVNLVVRQMLGRDVVPKARRLDAVGEEMRGCKKAICRLRAVIRDFRQWKT